MQGVKRTNDARSQMGPTAYAKGVGIRTPPSVDGGRQVFGISRIAVATPCPRSDQGDGMNSRRLFCTGMMGAALAACSGLPSTPAGNGPVSRQEVKVIVFPGGFNWPLWVGLAQDY